MKSSPASVVAFSGVMFALALVFSWLESYITPMLGLPPGVKIGLANIVVLYMLLFSSRKQAFFLVVLKAGFSFLTRGTLAFALSLCGGVLSLLVMLIILPHIKKIGVFILSISGALAHNIGQLALIWVFFGTFSLYYAPVLIVSGVAMGLLTAFLLRVLLVHFPKLGR